MTREFEGNNQKEFSWSDKNASWTEKDLNWALIV
jgi:hypothetical protein